MTLRELPPVHELIERLQAELPDIGRERLKNAIQSELDHARKRLQAGESFEADSAYWKERVSTRLSRAQELRAVINATGVLLHTGLGRAPLSAAAIDAISRAGAGSCDLEFDLDSGDRGKREARVEALLRQITGAEAAAVVNNNAAATLLVLRALAAGREVVVSRGQLVEIGGSFRLPEILAASGAILREVGTTNRTRIGDYAAAIGPQTCALLRVHPSNYRVVGFTEEATIEELAELARERSLLCLDDIGSGALGPGRPRGIAPDEPTFASSLASGADLVLASGDKLLGGPQCGLALGQSAVVARLKADPLARAMRVDKLTLAALEATLRLAEDVEAAHRGIPLWAFLDSTCSELTVRGRSILRALAGTDWKVSLEYTTATVGGGSVPGQLLASVAVRLSPPFPSGMAEAGAVAHLLRLGEPSVVGRVSEGFVWLDLRAIPPECDELLVEAVRRCGVGARSFAPTGAALNDTVE